MRLTSVCQSVLYYRSYESKIIKISFGIYACSPEESSFTAIFSDMKITECMWKAHDGQQPD